MRLVEIRQSAGGHVAKDVRIVRHVLAIVSACNDCVAQAMDQPRLLRARALHEVARILVEERRERCVTEKVAGQAVAVFGCEALAEGGGVIPIAGIGVVLLFKAGSDAYGQEEMGSKRS